MYIDDIYTYIYIKIIVLCLQEYIYLSANYDIVAFYLYLICFNFCYYLLTLSQICICFMCIHSLNYFTAD